MKEAALQALLPMVHHAQRQGRAASCEPGLKHTERGYYLSGNLLQQCQGCRTLLRCCWLQGQIRCAGSLSPTSMNAQSRYPELMAQRLLHGHTRLKPAPWSSISRSEYTCTLNSGATAAFCDLAYTVWDRIITSTG